jgi:hypothetical protein
MGRIGLSINALAGPSGITHAHARESRVAPPPGRAQVVRLGGMFLPAISERRQARTRKKPSYEPLIK